MRGKDKCKILKQIRRQIAEENDIPYVVEECKHKGECKGTCPKCEADLKMLERELSLRHRLGKTVAIAGIAAGMLTMTTGCNIDDAEQLLKKTFGIESHEQLSGDVICVPEEDHQEGTVGENEISDDFSWGDWELSGAVVIKPWYETGFLDD